MALFANQCRFNCGKTFATLGELIYHIEEIHIDYDPQTIEQKEQSQPTCLPLSYVLRFVTEAHRIQNQSKMRETLQQQAQTPTSPIESPLTPTTTCPGKGTATSAQGILGSNNGNNNTSNHNNNNNTLTSNNNNNNGTEIKRKLAITHHSYSLSSNRSNTPTGSEAMSDDEPMLSESEDSNDSWTTEEFSSEFIMKYGVNGLFNCRVRKGFKCQCGKSYKTAQGLKRHAMLSNHSTQNMAEGANGNGSPSSSGNSGTSSGLLGLSSSTAMKNSMNLVTLKTKPSLVSISAANKLVKFVSDASGGSGGGSNGSKSSASSPSSSIVQSPSGNNSLGILTPATSPKQQHPHLSSAGSNITGNTSSTNNDTDTDTENCSIGKTNYDET
ncbi:homeobox protein 2 isoform X2 [Culicoides brevitarsis]|uniref:homeobox protein 2 isoform X2 n=1 Tax=Culicoides brevitarsis TaxID=469753 RepID=UPI00307B1662